MKRLKLAVFTVLSLLIAIIGGCTGQEAQPPPADVTLSATSTCVACHTDEDTLREVASAETGEAQSEATSGEG